MFWISCMIVVKLNWYKHQSYKLETVGSTPTATTC